MDLSSLLPILNLFSQPQNQVYSNSQPQNFREQNKDLTSISSCYPSYNLDEKITYSKNQPQNQNSFFPNAQNQTYTQNASQNQMPTQSLFSNPETLINLLSTFGANLNKTGSNSNSILANIQNIFGGNKTSKNSKEDEKTSKIENFKNVDDVELNDN